MWGGRASRGARIREAAAGEPTKKLTEVAGARHPGSASLVEPLDNDMHDLGGGRR